MLRDDAGTLTTPKLPHGTDGVENPTYHLLDGRSQARLAQTDLRTAARRCQGEGIASLVSRRWSGDIRDANVGVSPRRMEHLASLRLGGGILA